MSTLNSNAHFEGKPCVKCGSTTRYINYRRCVACNNRINKEVYTRDPLKKAVRAAAWRAERDGREFSVRLEDLEIPELCPVLGVPLVRPSLDRKNNDKGYTKENTKVISWEANRIKHALTLEQVRALLQYMEN